jgi:hypothetical protein
MPKHFSFSSAAWAGAATKARDIREAAAAAIRARWFIWILLRIKNLNTTSWIGVCLRGSSELVEAWSVLGGLSYAHPQFFSMQTATGGYFREKHRHGQTA